LYNTVKILEVVSASEDYGVVKKKSMSTYVPTDMNITHQHFKL